MRWSERLRTGAGLAVMLACTAPAMVMAAEPSATTAPGGDPRSAGEGPGLVGDPLWAIVIVAAIAIASLLGTLAYIRATAGGRADRSD